MHVRVRVGGDLGTLSLPTSVQIPGTLKVTQEICVLARECVCVCACVCDRSRSL